MSLDSWSCDGGRRRLRCSDESCRRRSCALTYGGAVGVCHIQSPWINKSSSLSLTGQRKYTAVVICFILCLYFLFLRWFYFSVFLLYCTHSILDWGRISRLPPFRCAFHVRFLFTQAKESFSLWLSVNSCLDLSINH